MLAACDVEPLTDRLARLAGRALREVRSSETIDAIVIASAAQRGDIVLTQDESDLNPFTAFFPGVRVVGL